MNQQLEPRTSLMAQTALLKLMVLIVTFMQARPESPTAAGSLRSPSGSGFFARRGSRERPQSDADIGALVAKAMRST